MDSCNGILRSAIRSERKGNWTKVVKKYEELITLLAPDKLSTKHRLREKALTKLLYECHVHCGDAYQHLEQTTKAIDHYKNAIKIISIKKINCCVGCVSGQALHLQVPVLAKIALCNIQQGQYQMALIRVDEAMRRDSKNADLFCIKACTNFLNKDILLAINIINQAIWLSPKHVCAWLLRGIFRKTQGQTTRATNKDFEMAHSLEYTTISYNTTEMNPSKINSILRRYLPTLRVSHSVYPGHIVCDDEDRTTTNTPTTTCSQRITDTGRSLKSLNKTTVLCGTTSSFHL